MICCLATATAVIAGGIAVVRRRRAAAQGGAPRTPMVRRSKGPDRDGHVDDRVDDGVKEVVVRGLLP
jgi:hypothetical protein